MFAKTKPKGRRKYNLQVEEDDLTTNFYEVDKKKKNDKCTKTPKKNKRDSESPYEVLRQCTNKINVKYQMQTVPKIKKAVRGCGYQFSILSDDLTASMIPTPPSIEHLFTNRLTERKSISSTPKSSRHVPKNIVLKKGSLKQKRWVMTNLKRKSQEYEDDLFENSKIQLPLLLDDSDLPDLNISTPKCVHLSPTKISKTPPFKDCYSPTQLFLARKNAEEYMHRRNKKRKNCSTVENETSTPNKIIIVESDTEVSLEAGRLECLELVDTLKKKLNSKELNEDSEEDDYFNNVSF